MSTRLSALAAQLGVAQEPVDALVTSLAGGRPPELSVSLQSKGLGAMFRGEDPAFSQRALQLAEAWGFSDAARATLSQDAARFEHRRAFFKVDFGEDGVRELSMYWRRRPPMDRVLSWLCEIGSTPEDILRVTQAAQLLTSPNLHFWARSYGKDGQARIKLYWTQRGEPRLWPGVERLLTLQGVDPACLSAVDRSLDRFLSLELDAQGHVLPGAKLDLHGASVELAGSFGAGVGGQERALALLRTGPLDYVGLRLGAGVEQVKLYSTRT